MSLMPLNERRRIDGLDGGFNKSALRWGRSGSGAEVTASALVDVTETERTASPPSSSGVPFDSFLLNAGAVAASCILSGPPSRGSEGGR